MSVNSLTDREERPPYIRFEQRPVQDKQESIKQGRYIAKDVDFVLITPPYSKDCVEHKVENWLQTCEQNLRNNRIPREWLDRWKEGYQRWKDGLDVPVNGTSVKNWPGASPAQIKNMIASNILTIEDMAACNDEGLRRLGFGGIDLRNKAKAYLQAAEDHGPLAEQNTQLIKDNKRLAKQVESLSEKVNLLSTQVQGKEVPRETIEIDDLLDPVAEPVVTVDYDSMSDSEAKQAYIEKFGKQPHYKMKPTTIIRHLKE